MKKGENVLIGWGDVISQTEKVDLIGYSSVSQISAKTGTSMSAISAKLKRLRDREEIDAVQAKNETGKLTWYYKD